MTFTGTLIDDLMATVERAEQRTQTMEAFMTEPRLIEAMLLEPAQVDPVLVECWLASVQNNADYDSRIVGVA